MDENKDTYFATSEYLDRLKKAFPYYEGIQDAFENGEATVELKKRFMLNAIDERWIVAIEDTLPSLDVILRTPGTSLFEHEAIMPVELTRKITSKSVRHLSQHTNFINEIRDDGTVFPSQLLNVFQEDEIYNYENKFINTLLARVYAFVSVRYSAAKDNAVDERQTTLKFNQAFDLDDCKGKIDLSIEVNENAFKNEVQKNYIYTTDLWSRVENIRIILNEYMGTKFITSMGRQYLKPPITRTNKLLKNPDFRQCLDLWEFLESYDIAGYETTVQESVEQVDQKCIKDMYNAMSAQFIIFQYFIHNRFDFENTLDFASQETFHPEVKEEIDPLKKDEFAFHHVTGGATDDENQAFEDDKNIADAIRVALAIDDLYLAEEKKREPVTTYRYSYMARLIQAEAPCQDYYTEIKNALMKYLGMSSKISWDNEKFKVGRDLMAIMNVRGNVLYLYLAIDPTVYAQLGIKVKDASNKSSFKEVPLFMKVKNDKNLKDALHLIDHLGLLHSLRANIAFESVDYHMPYQTLEELCEMDPPLIKVINAVLPGVKKDVDENDTTPVYKFSYEARKIMASDQVKNVYSQVMNTFKSFKGVSTKVTWDNETIKANKEKVAVLNFHGKSLYLYLAIDPTIELNTKLKHTDVSDKKKFEATPVLFKLKTERGLKSVLSLIESLLKSLGVKVNGIYRQKNFVVPFAPPEELARRNPPLVKLVRGVLPEYVPEEETKEEVEEQSSYSYSFMAHLIQSPSDIQSFYSSLKNNILSYKNMKCKENWSNETYKAGRSPLIQLKIRGKAVTMLMNSNPELYQDIKGLKIKEGSKFAITLKIKNEKTLDVALNSLKIMMDDLGITQGKVPKVNYKKKYQSTEALLALPIPLVKEKVRVTNNE